MRKRGKLSLLVVLFLFTTLLLPILASAQLILNEEKYVGITYAWDPDYDRYPPRGKDLLRHDCSVIDNGEENTQNYGGGCLWRLGASIIKSGLECDFSSYNQPSKSLGCWFFIEDDDSDSHDGGAGRAVLEQIIDSTTRRLNVEGETTVCDSAEAKEQLEKGASFFTNQPLICLDDNFWHLCNNINTGTIIHANNYIYNCSLDDIGLLRWQKLSGFDLDHDGYTDQMGDCQDDPSQDPSYCSELKTPEDCGEGNVYNAKCSICIHPSASEICGDGIDNDCDAETSDDCHKNKEACEESFIEGVSVEEAPPTEDGTEPAPVPGSYAYNIYRESFSWINTDDGGYCCGYEGINDLGVLKEGTGEFSGNYLCLNEEKSLVGYEDAVASVFNPSEADPSGTADRCLGNWCWINAIGGPPGGAQFHIFTIKKPDQQPYDVVSNSQEWFECNENEPKTLVPPLMAGAEEVSYLELANRFYCYQEGQHWSWKE